jgi:L-ornithine Nalpha-acyltransferase
MWSSMSGKPVPALRAHSGAGKPEAISQTAQILGRLGTLEVRLARSAAEVRRAQGLRYQVFYKEMCAAPGAGKMIAQRDVDHFDTICDHLIVLDHESHSPTGELALVGTYRLLRQHVAERSLGFYNAREFDIGALIARHRGRKFVELSRACVLPAYRNKRIIELLWHGIWTYVLQHEFDVMIGCASFEGTDLDELALPLSFLHHFGRAPEGWRVRAKPQYYVEMNRLSKEHVDKKAAVSALPPLVKGYLRLGAFFGEGAVIDHHFCAAVVLVVLPVSTIRTRYTQYFGSDTRWSGP